MTARNLQHEPWASAGVLAHAVCRQLASERPDLATAWKGDEAAGLLRFTLHGPQAEHYASHLFETLRHASYVRAVTHLSLERYGSGWAVTLASRVL